MDNTALDVVESVAQQPVENPTEGLRKDGKRKGEKPQYIAFASQPIIAATSKRDLLKALEDSGAESDVLIVKGKLLPTRRKMRLSF